jgi:DNA primase
VPGRINPEDKDAVRERSDIVKIVSGYLQLKKTGRDSYSGICPFHQEKTPSFSVSPSKQVFYCFGCGEGGDVIKFVERVENLTFAEAVERLAEQAGVRLRYEGQSDADRKVAGRRQAMHRVNAEAGTLFHRMLLEGKEAAEAREYLQSRGVTAESVEKFAVGYAPGYSDFLLRRLSSSFGPELLVEAGLVARDGQNALLDRFRGRVTFPIHDVSGNAVGFGGRLMQPKDRPPIQAAKYVNSSDSPVYHKSSLLYNLHRAKTSVAGDRRAYLVEGYTDVIALDQVGVPEVVATCGTALGEEHVRVLSRFTDRLVLAFDSDEAGARAAERAFQFHQQYAVDFLVLVLPQGQDPADFVLARGEEAGEAFRTLSERAVPLVEFMLHRLMAGRALDTPEERSRAVREGLALLAGIEDPVRRQQYVPLVADLTGVTSGSVTLELDRLVAQGAPDAARQGGRTSPAPAARAQATRVPPAQQIEREALKLLVRFPDIRSARLAGLDPTRFSGATLRKVFDFLREAPAKANVVDLVSLAKDRSDALGSLLSSLALEPLKVGEPPAADSVEAVFLRLDEFGIRRQAEDLRKELQPLNPLKDRETYDALFKRLVAMEGERRRLREEAERLEARDAAL